MRVRVLRVLASDPATHEAHYAQTVLPESMWASHGPRLTEFYAEALIHDVAEVAPAGCEWRGYSEWATDIED